MTHGIMMETIWPVVSREVLVTTVIQLPLDVSAPSSHVTSNAVSLLPSTGWKLVASVADGIARGASRKRVRATAVESRHRVGQSTILRISSRGSREGHASDACYGERTSRGVPSQAYRHACSARRNSCSAGRVGDACSV